MHIQQSALKNPTVTTIARRRVGRGGGGGDDSTDNDNDKDKDHNNNTTIKKCTGEKEADKDGDDRQLQQQIGCNFGIINYSSNFCPFLGSRQKYQVSVSI